MLIWHAHMDVSKPLLIQYTYTEYGFCPISNSHTSLPSVALHRWSHTQGCHVPSQTSSNLNLPSITKLHTVFSLVNRPIFSILPHSLSHFLCLSLDWSARPFHNFRHFFLLKTTSNNLISNIMSKFKSSYDKIVCISK